MLEVGNVTARLGAVIDDRAFVVFDRKLRDARQAAVRDVAAGLRGDYDDTAFARYDRELAKARRNTERSVEAKLDAKGDKRAFDAFDRDLTKARRATERPVNARLDATADTHAIDEYDRNLNEARRNADRRINATLDAKADTRGIDKYNSKLDDTNAGHRNLTTSSAAAGAGVGKLAGAAGVVSVGAVAMGGLALATNHAVNAFDESNKVAKQTDAVLKSTGGVANVTAKNVSDLATSISRKTGIDDEAVQSSENLLLTFTNVRNEAGKGNDIFTQSTRTIQDMSTALGQDGKSSAIQLGKALNDPIKGITALSRVGVSFTQQKKDEIKTLTESGKRLEAQKIILAELKTEFGGSAASAATGSKKTAVALGNLEETIGGKLKPTFNAVTGVITKFVNGMTDGTGAGGRFVSILKTVGSVAGGVFRAGFKAGGDALRFVGELIKDNRGTIDSIGGTLKRVAVLGGNALRQIASAFRSTFGSNGTGKDVKVVVKALLTIIDAVLKVYEAIVRKVLPSIVAYFKGFAQAIRGVIKVLSGIFTLDFGKMWDGVKDIFAGGLKAIYNLVKASPLGVAIEFIMDGVSKVVTGAWRFISGTFTGALKSVSGIVRSWGGALGNAAGSVVNAISGAFSGGWNAILRTAAGFVNAIIDVINLIPFVNIGHVSLGGGGGSSSRSAARAVASYAKGRKGEPERRKRVVAADTPERRKWLADMRRVWPAAAPYYGQKPDSKMPRVMFSKQGYGYVGDTYNLAEQKGQSQAKLRARTQQIMWPDWIGGPLDNAANQNLLIHEWAHYFQSNALQRKGSVWQQEGGAQAFARRVTPAIFAELGIKYRNPRIGVDQYTDTQPNDKGTNGTAWKGGAVGKVEALKDAAWILSGQFGKPGPRGYAAGKPGQIIGTGHAKTKTSTLGGIVDFIGSIPGKAIDSVKSLVGAVLPELPAPPNMGPLNGMVSYVLSKASGAVKALAGKAWKTITGRATGREHGAHELALVGEGGGPELVGNAVDGFDVVDQPTLRLLAPTDYVIPTEPRYAARGAQLAASAFGLSGYAGGTKAKAARSKKPPTPKQILKGASGTVVKANASIAQLETGIARDERDYARRDRELSIGADDNYVIEHDDGSTTINTELVKKRVGQINELAGLRAKIKQRIHDYWKAVRAAIAKIGDAVSKLKNARGKAGKSRPSYDSAIKKYTARIGDLRELEYSLGADEDDSRLDLADLAQEAAELTKLAPTAAPAKVEDPPVADPGSDPGTGTPGDPGTTTPDPVQLPPSAESIAQGVAEQFAAFTANRADLFASFGSNFTTARANNDATTMAAGRRYYGATGADDPTAGAGPGAVTADGTPIGAGKSIAITNNFAAPPPDPHLWARGQEFELNAT